MSDALDRRSFLGTAALAVAGTALPGAAGGAAPWVRRSRAAKFAAVSSANGLRGVKLAVELMQKGTDTLDAGVEGVKIQELDPDDDSVGYGGLPNEDGVVQLDASCVHGPTRRAGAVAALEGIKTPSEVARLVLKYTDHILLVGEGAKRFALSYGFKEENLLTPKSREKWLRWRANRGKGDDWVDIPDGAPAMARPTGTINMDLINDKGEISSITTTSGLAWKIPGRAGDSPILGAGLYVDGDVGAAGSTGRGEANLYNLSSFLIVEEMRRGAHPKDAAMTALKRVAKNTIEKRLLNAKGQPNFGLNFYVLNAKGEYAGVSMYEGTYAVCTDKGPETLKTDALYEGRPTD